MEILLHPFTLGLILGLIFALLALYRFFTLKHEFARYRRHLSDKLEVEAEMQTNQRKEKEKLQEENRNLQMQVERFNQAPDRRASRDLEIYARAEKKLVVSVPGFASAWEKAKEEAESEVAEEEQGRSIPRKVFNKLFGKSGRRPDPNDDRDSQTTFRLEEKGKE